MASLGASEAFGTALEAAVKVVEVVEKTSEAVGGGLKWVESDRKKEKQS